LVVAATVAPLVLVLLVAIPRFRELVSQRLLRLVVALAALMAVAVAVVVRVVALVLPLALLVLELRVRVATVA